MVPHVRWNVPEKSYPPRSRHDAKEGLRFGKSAPFPYYPVALEIPAREDAISLFAVISRATRTTNAGAGIREREETERERNGSGCPGDKRGETSARACVCRSVGVRGYNERSRVEGRESESEGEEPGRGAERERDVGRGRERETGRKREEALSPTTGGENYPESAWGVRPRRRGEPSASEASAVPDTHQVPYGTRLEARTVRHSPLGDTTHAGPSSLWSTPASGNQHPRRRHQVAVPDSHISLPRPYVNEDAVSSHVDVDVDVASP